VVGLPLKVWGSSPEWKPLAGKATLKKTSDPLYETCVHEKSFCQLPWCRRWQLYAWKR